MPAGVERHRTGRPLSVPAGHGDDRALGMDSTDRTPATLDEAAREILVGAAILAPSMHNTQPWRFRFSGTGIEVHRDPRYELPAEDPERRMSLTSIGAVVFNLRAAAAHLGYQTTVTLHDTTYHTLAAEVGLGALAADPELADLYA